MTFSYSFLLTVTTQVQVVVNSDTELSNAQVIEKAVQDPSGCDYRFDELDWGDIKYALENLQDQEKEHLEVEVEAEARD